MLNVFKAWSNVLANGEIGVKLLLTLFKTGCRCCRNMKLVSNANFSLSTNLYRSSTK